jgi:hypothetical protein
VNHVAGDCEQISFGAADLLEALDAQQAQEYLLGKIGRISAVAESRREKAAQTLTMFRRDFGDENPLGLGKQVGSILGHRLLH